MAQRWTSSDVFDGSGNPVLAGVRGAQTPTPPYPILLQQHAATVVRKQMLRDAIRASVLMAADLSVLACLRTALQALRDRGLLGAHVEALADVFMPRGTLRPLELGAAVVLGLFVFGTYRAGDNRRDARGVFLGTGLGVGLVAWSRLWTIDSPVTVLGFLLTAAGVGCATAAARFAIDAVVGRVRPERRRSAHMLVVGPGAEAQQALRHLSTGDSTFVPVGFLDTCPQVSREAVGGISDLVWALQGYHVDAVVLCGCMPTADATDVTRLASAAGCQVFELPRAFVPGYLEPEIAWRRGIPLLMLTRPGVQGAQLGLKRAFDLAAASLSLVALSPLLCAIAAAVRLSSPGPVIFTQTRVGRGGRYFRIYKFRSMVADAEARRGELAAHSIYTDDRLFKVKHDPRVTGLGAFLRRTSMDELPQLWNVLRGEMSLVGPRPPLPSELSRYEEREYARFDMKPGITGPWQVSGRNRITSFDEVIRLETEYMRRWSIWRDVGILLRTIPAVCRVEEAH